MITGYSGDTFPNFTPNPWFARAYERGEVEVEHWSFLAFTQRLEAAARGLPAVTTRSIAGSSMAENDAYHAGRHRVRRGRSARAARARRRAAARAGRRPAGQRRVARAAARRRVGRARGPPRRDRHRRAGRRRPAAVVTPRPHPRAPRARGRRGADGRAPRWPLRRRPPGRRLRRGLRVLGRRARRDPIATTTTAGSGDWVLDVEIAGAVARAASAPNGSPSCAPRPRPTRGTPTSASTSPTSTRRSNAWERAAVWGARYLAERDRRNSSRRGARRRRAWRTSPPGSASGLAREQGSDVQLTAEIGLWGYEATPADPFVLNHRNFPTATMLSDAADGARRARRRSGHDDDRLPRRRPDRPQRQRELHVDSAQTVPRRIRRRQRRREHRGGVRRGRDAHAGAHAGAVRVRHVARSRRCARSSPTSGSSRSTAASWCSRPCRQDPTDSRIGSQRHAAACGWDLTVAETWVSCRHRTPTRSRRCGDGTPAAGSCARSVPARMARVVLDRVTKRFGDVTAVDDLSLDIADREFLVLLGPSGCGKSTALAHDRRPRGSDRRHHPHRRSHRQRRRAQGPRHRDGVPELRALPAHDGAPEHRVPAADPQASVPRSARKLVDEAARDPRPRRAARPQARTALRRAAPTRRARPRDRAPPGRVPDGRAALEPRRQAARRDARRARRAAPPARDDGRLRHARPGRGDDDGHPHRDPRSRPAPADRAATGRLRPAREPLRRRVHRQPADEHRHRTPSSATPDAPRLRVPGRRAQGPRERGARRSARCRPRDVVLGVRPEHLRLGAARDPGRGHRRRVARPRAARRLPAGRRADADRARSPPTRPTPAEGDNVHLDADRARCTSSTPRPGRASNGDERARARRRRTRRRR